MQLCLNHLPGEVMAVSVTDTPNSELVLHREDDEVDPRSGYEIARGDRRPPGAGWWMATLRVGAGDLKPKEYVPGRIEHFIGSGDCERLFRRYELAKRIRGKTFKSHEQTKPLEYLGSASAASTKQRVRADRASGIGSSGAAGLRARV
jgi:hypothetical protein